MADLTPRSGNRMTRRGREQRALRLVTTGGIAAVVAVVTGLLAILTSLSWALPVIAAIVAAVCFVMFRGMTTPRR